MEWLDIIPHYRLYRWWSYGPTCWSKTRSLRWSWFCCIFLLDWQIHGIPLNKLFVYYLRWSLSSNKFHLVLSKSGPFFLNSRVYSIVQTVQGAKQKFWQESSHCPGSDSHTTGLVNCRPWPITISLSVTASPSQTNFSDWYGFLIQIWALV